VSPYPNFHSCRLKDPKDFQKGSFRQIKKGKLTLIIGRPEGKTTTTTQAYRYPKDAWSAEEARAHCEKAGGTFEPARKMKSPMTISEITPGNLKEVDAQELLSLHRRCHQLYGAHFKDAKTRGSSGEDQKGASPDPDVPDADGGGRGAEQAPGGESE